MSKFTNNMLDGSLVLTDAITTIRAKTDARREIESKILVENNLGSKNQLYAGSLLKFNHIVDTLIETPDSKISHIIFERNAEIELAAKDNRFTPRNSTMAKAEPLAEGIISQYKKSAADRRADENRPEDDDEYGPGPWPKKKKLGSSPEKETARRLNKEETGLQELSKTTLGSYVKKASHDVAHKGAVTREFANRSREDRKNDNYVGARKNNELSDKTFDKSWNRRKNMAKAVDRLTKEDLEERYLDIENFVLESEGFDSIDRLNEQGQKKLAAIVENVMEEILSEESNLQEISAQKAKTTYEKTGEALKKARESGDTETERKREKGNFMSYKRVTGAPKGRREFGEDHGRDANNVKLKK